MSFFSWFRSKSEKSEQDELELKGSHEAPETHADAENSPPQSSRVPPPRLRETVPGSRPKPASPADSTSTPREGFRRPLRATVDVPLQVLLLQLPTDVTKSNIDIDPKRRVQIPRKALQIDEARQTANVTFATLFASCPDIFSVPIAPLDQRTLEFNLPAWERSRLAESGEKTGSTTASSEAASATLIPTDEANEKTGALPASRFESSRKSAGPDRLTSSGELLPAEKRPAAEVGKPDETSPATAERNGSESPRTVRVALAPILKNLPPELQPSEPAALANAPGAAVEIPLELINSQLATGRVTIPFSTLLASLPEEARAHFPQADPTTEVPIPIKEILQNYPEDLLRPRPDQEPEEVLPSIATPFTAPAKEDTERFSKLPVETQAEPSAPDSHQLELIESTETPTQSPTPVAHEVPITSETPVAAEKPVTEEKVVAEEKTVTEEKPLVEHKTAPDFAALQSVFLTEEALDLNKVVQKVGELPGVNSALFFAADGSLQGEPEKLGLTQSSVQLLSSLSHEIGQRVGGLGLGQIETVTLGWKRELVSVFTRGESGFVIRHEKRPFKPGVREKICLVLSHICK
jgi:hypothetical protein